MLLKDVFRRPAKLYPGKIAVIDGDRKLTFRELDTRINRLANALLSMGISKGDRLGVLLKNCGEYFEIIGAGARTGIVIVPINFRLALKELGYLINDAQFSAIILHADYAGLIHELIKDRPMVSKCIAIGQPSDGMLSYEFLLQGGAAQLHDMPVEEDDIVPMRLFAGFGLRRKLHINTSQTRGPCIEQF